MKKIIVAASACVTFVSRPTVKRVVIARGCAGGGEGRLCGLDGEPHA